MLHSAPKMDPRRHRLAFTLVEMLVVVLVLLILSSIALPLTKKLLNDQKTAKAAQSLEAFIGLARSRAISEGRVVGVRIERLSNLPDAGAGRSTSTVVRQLVGVPPYTGDASDAKAVLKGNPVPTTIINSAEFENNDSPLLALSVTLLNHPDPRRRQQAPIRIGDILELPGGRTVAINGLATNGMSTTATFNLFEPVDGFDTFPSPARTPINATGDSVRFRIHRSPVPSRSKVLSLTRGIAIDLNYSGVGIGGVTFAPDRDGANAVGAVDILFRPDGSVSTVINNGNRSSTTSLIFLCMGTIDGVADIQTTTTDDAFAATKRFTANIRSADSVWIVINPSTGQVTSSPIALIDSTVEALRAQGTPPDFANPTEAAFIPAIREARKFATLSDTVNQ